MGRHTGYDVLGAKPMLDGLDRETALARIRAAEDNDWTDVPLGEVAIEWHLTNYVGEETIKIEGVEVAIMVGGGIAPPDHHVLTHLVRVVQERDRAATREREGRVARSAHNTQVDLAADFIDQHGPLWLCDEHGLPVGHTPDCEECWERDRVSHIVSLAEQCRAALSAAETLRAGRPIESEDHEVLRLPDSPPVRVAYASEKDRERVRARLANPIVEDWRRLEAWLKQLKGRVHPAGIFPAIVQQLAAACHRDGVRRVCKNLECPKDFVPKKRSQRYCENAECGKSRLRQRQAKLHTCSHCGKKISAKLEACGQCGAQVEPSVKTSSS